MTRNQKHSKMERDENYYDYSAIDAPEHLLQALEHFFDTEQNPYKFTLPKKHFNALKRDSDFPDAHRIFKIITGTTLVTNKTVQRYRTSQGLRYMINKEFSQNARRAQRAQRRTEIREKPDTTKSTKEQTIHLQVIPVHPTNIHPETGIPQINFDQFINLCQTHQEVLEKANTVNYDDEVNDTSTIIVNK